MARIRLRLLGDSIQITRNGRGPVEGTRGMVVEGDFDFEVEDLESYVQVKTVGYSGLTYRDPSGTLEVGDRVIVPLGWKNSPALGSVIGIGRGGYDGLTKDVESRVFVQELAA